MERPQVKTLLKQGNIYLRTYAHESYCSITILKQKSSVTPVKAEHSVFGQDKKIEQKSVLTRRSYSAEELPQQKLMILFIFLVMCVLESLY